ncbi:uncharacterized protein BXZ73DRAFT_82927 [Epithele typhae]|uniref:uncharacterized protein n=1 Tax=Epithele typhae TaxID=378194 RepID=UPI002008A22A|nr:uncharacterized protein BXZ73DRAFT_82927 [Epithele typhae]KAH9911220.1 hypothetical protein BXZ73DRAFT_82927 [Epithele typhae]
MASRPSRPRAGKKTARPQAQEPPSREIPAEPTTLTYTLARFNQMLSLLVQDAARHQRFEAYLYPLYNHIATIQSMTLELPPTDDAGPYLGAFLAPQPLLGFNLAENEAAPQDPDSDSEEAPTVTTAAREAAQSGKLIGDFARVLGLAVNPDELSSKHRHHFPFSRQIIDIWELKRQYPVSSWFSKQARADAEAVMKTSFEQVYNQAMIEFLHNPDLNQLYSFLIVGGQFAQLLWERPEDLDEDTYVKGLKEIPIPPDASTLAEEALSLFRVRLEEQLSIFRTRALPQVLYANEPVFVVSKSEKSRWHNKKTKMLSAHYQAVTLSPAFLQALEYPLVARFKSLRRTCDLFAPPGGFVNTNPPPGTRRGYLPQFFNMLQKNIRNKPIQRLTERLKAAGFVERQLEAGEAGTEDGTSSAWEPAPHSQASNSSTDTRATNDYVPSDDVSSESISSESVSSDSESVGATPAGRRPKYGQQRSGFVRARKSAINLKR